MIVNYLVFGRDFAPTDTVNVTLVVATIAIIIMRRGGGRDRD